MKGIASLRRVFTTGTILAILAMPLIADADTEIGTPMASGSGTNMRFADNGDTNPHQVCQIFSGLSGTVDYVKVYMSQRGSGGTGTITISLQSVSGTTPTGSILTSGTIPFTSLTGSPAQYSISMDSPYTISSGVTYAMCGANDQENDGTDGVYFNGDSSQYSGYPVRYQESVSNVWDDYGTNAVNLELWSAGGGYSEGAYGGGGATSSSEWSVGSSTALMAVDNLVWHLTIVLGLAVTGLISICLRLL